MAVQGTAVLDPNAQLEDIFWEIYHWLDGHPTETILVSFKVDNSNNTAELKQKSVQPDHWQQCEVLVPKHTCMLLQDISHPPMDK